MSHQLRPVQRFVGFSQLPSVEPNVSTERVNICTGQNACKTFCVDSRADEFIFRKCMKEDCMKSLT
jgi:hypothetical protein